MFSTIDEPGRRFLSITATDEHQSFRVIAAASDLALLNGVSPSTITRFIYRPTSKVAAGLARSVLEGGLAPVAYPVLPSRRVIHSQEYGEAVRAAVDGFRALEVVAPVYDSTVHQRVNSVTVQVMRIAFQSTVSQPVLRPVGPAGLAAAERSTLVGW